MKLSMSERQQIFAINVSHLIQYIFTGGYACTLGEVYRPKETAEIYANEGKGIANSQHCERLAIDINLFSPSGQYENKTENYAHFGKYWESLHPDNRWGGRFPTRIDCVHFEMRG